MTSKKRLKVIVDEDLLDPKIIAALQKVAAVDVKTLLNCGFRQGTEDHILVAGTEKQSRLLLTANYRDINERIYKPCNHGGIILIKHRRPNAEVVASRLKAFCKSEKRPLAERHVTYLRAEGFTIHKLHKEVIEERY